MTVFLRAHSLASNAAVLSIAAMAFAAPPAHAELYTIEQLGFTGPGYEHESDGRAVSFATYFTPDGRAAGESTRYAGDIQKGNETWIDDGDGPTAVGFRGDDFVWDVDGRVEHDLNGINASGQVIGTSRRYEGDDYFGKIAWRDDGSGPVQLGLYDGVNRADTGLVSNEPVAINTHGLAVGEAARYQNGVVSGTDAWIDNGSGPIRVGLRGGDYESSSGQASIRVGALNNAGWSAGTSNTYDGDSVVGRHGWIDNGNGTTRIAQGAGPYRYDFVSVFGLDDQGQAYGSAPRLNQAGESLNRNDAWLYDGTDTHRIGLTGPEFTDASGNEMDSEWRDSNDNGTFWGYTNRSPDAGAGRAAWSYDGNDVRRIGLWGDGYQRDDGLERTNFERTSNSQFAAGTSDRFDFGAGNGFQASIGYDAWIDDGQVTQRVGLYGPGYTSRDGESANDIEALNSFGQVAGETPRYPVEFNPAGSLGDAGWFYDWTTGITHELVFDQRESDGFADTVIDALSEDGVVFGRYATFPTETDVEWLAFMWDVERGKTDLPDAIVGFEEEDWIKIEQIDIAIGGEVYGSAEIASLPPGYYASFRLTPVPEPTAILPLAGLLGLALRRR